MLASSRWMAAPGIVLAMTLVTGRALLANGNVEHCAEFVTYPKQQCTRLKLKETDGECESDGLFWENHAQRCKATGLYKGIGLEGDTHPDSKDCTGWFDGETEWCFGVACQDTQVQDPSACKRCNAGYEFGSTQTTHVYNEEVIGNLCTNKDTDVDKVALFYKEVQNCPSGYTDAGDHPTSESLCSDKKLLTFTCVDDCWEEQWGGSRTALCRKQATQRVSHTTQCTKTVVDYCASKTCSNRGRCSNGATTYTCKCNAGYEGKDCQTRTNYCADKTCSDRGSCSNGATTYTCNCNAGYEGKDCQTEIKKCTRGESFNIQENSCEACPDGKYNSANNHQMTECLEQPSCPPGTFYVLDWQDPLALERTCVLCIGTDKYQDDGNHKDLRCKECPSGQTQNKDEGATSCNRVTKATTTTTTSAATTTAVTVITSTVNTATTKAITTITPTTSTSATATIIDIALTTTTIQTTTGTSPGEVNDSTSAAATGGTPADNEDANNEDSSQRPFTNGDDSSIDGAGSNQPPSPAAAESTQTAQGMSSGLIAGVVIVVLLAVVAIALVVQLRNKRPADIHGMNHPAAAHVQNAAYQLGQPQPHAQPGADAHVPPSQDYFAPVAGQADIYDAEARARLVSVREQSSVTGDTIVYAIPSEAAVTGDGLYVDDGYYAAGGAGAGVDSAGDAHEYENKQPVQLHSRGLQAGSLNIETGIVYGEFAAPAGGAGGNSATIVYATPAEGGNTEA